MGESLDEPTFSKNLFLDTMNNLGPARSWRLRRAACKPSGLRQTVSYGVDATKGSLVMAA